MDSCEGSTTTISPTTSLSALADDNDVSSHEHAMNAVVQQQKEKGGSRERLSSIVSIILVAVTCVLVVVIIIIIVVMLLVANLRLTAPQPMNTRSSSLRGSSWFWSPSYESFTTTTDHHTSILTPRNNNSTSLLISQHAQQQQQQQQQQSQLEEEQRWLSSQHNDNQKYETFKWHPDKADVDCEEYWRTRNYTVAPSGGNGEGWGGNGNGGGGKKEDHEDEDDEDDEEDDHDDRKRQRRRRTSDYEDGRYQPERFTPCREQGPPVDPWTQPPQQSPTAATEPPVPTTANSTTTTTTTDSVTTTTIPNNAIVIQVSLALPFQRFPSGIPKRMASVIKQYLNTTQVKVQFVREKYWNEVYQDDRHFLLDFIPWTPLSQVIETEEEESSSNCGDGDDCYDEEIDDWNRRLSNKETYQQQQLQQGQGQSQPSWAQPQQKEESQSIDDWDGSLESLVDLHSVNITDLGLFSVAVDASLVDSKQETGYAWFQHTVILLAHERPFGDVGARYSKVENIKLMLWLQRQIQNIVYDDIRLNGALGRFFDTNNRYQHSIDANRQISFLEWALQEQGIPIAGVAVPQEEHWDFIESSTADPWQPVFPDPLPQDDPIQEFLHPDDNVRTFIGPLDTEFEHFIQYLGLACLLLTTISTFILSHVANEVGKRREQDELWGNNMTFENAREDMSYLDVGWKFNAIPAAANVGGSGERKSNIDCPPRPILTMEVFDKTGVGYRDDDSLLIGGCPQKSSRRVAPPIPGGLETLDNTEAPQPREQRLRTNVGGNPVGGRSSR